MCRDRVYHFDETTQRKKIGKSNAPRLDVVTTFASVGTLLARVGSVLAHGTRFSHFCELLASLFIFSLFPMEKLCNIMFFED